METDLAREEMKQRYFDKEKNLMFKMKLKAAAEEGLLIFAKWALVVGLIYVALNIFTNIVSGANNGTNAILYIHEAIEKGHLPKSVNGQLPVKEKEDEKVSTVK